MIKTISHSQEEILSWISRLYLNEQPFELDATYSKGVFYQSGELPQPSKRFDLFPQIEGVELADCRYLPLEGSSIYSMILDLPFLATQGVSLKTEEGNLMVRRFGVYPNEKALYELYQAAMREAWRLLKPQGILVMKCQDKVSSGKQYMMHCDIYQWAKDLGFIIEDLFVLLAKTRLVAGWQRNQKHARKYHCYFWVFRKPKQKRR